MDVALLMNDRAARARFIAAIGVENAAVREYSTAADALREFASRKFDVMVIDWKIYPGYGCNDAEIRDLASEIPEYPHNENLLYWQVALKVIENIRGEESVNVDTPIVFRFPQLAETYLFGMGDDLTKEAIQADLDRKVGIEAVYGVNIEALAARVRSLNLK